MIKLYEVGGAVRDGLMGLKSKDVDFAVEAPSFEALRAYLVAGGFQIFVEKPEFNTIRAAVPKTHPLRERTRDADFVLCRKDGPSSDGRRPDYTEPGTILDDLARRDFTINAIARDVETGVLVDPHGGQVDIETRTLRFVGDPMARIREDGLRVLRGLRFIITKKLNVDRATATAIQCSEGAEMLRCVSIERIREEIEKMAAHDSVQTLYTLGGLPTHTMAAIFREGLRLSATLRAP